MLNFLRVPPRAGGKPSHVAIISHGLGDSGAGLMPIGEMWKHELPSVEFICPDAPFPYDGMPMPNARQWFTLRQFTMQEMHDGTTTAAPYLNDFIDHILESRALPAEKLALVGFSQGTIMSLYVGPRREKQLAGILGYSGILVGGESLVSDVRSKPPVMLVHGTVDDVVPYSVLEPSAGGLKRAGLNVETVTCDGLGHGIDDAGIAAGLQFLKRIFV